MKTASNEHSGTTNASPPDESPAEEGRGGDASAFVVRPAPWRVLRLYVWIALALTAGPLLVGLYAGLMGYFLTQVPVGEIWRTCVDLVGVAPILGLLVVLLGVPAGWVIFGDYRRQAWSVDVRGVSVLQDSVEKRRIPWSEVDTVRVTLNGPLLLLKDKAQEAEQLSFVPRETSVRLHRYWSRL